MQYIVNTSRLLVLNYFIIDNDVKDNAHNITHTHACIYTIKYKTYLAHTYYIYMTNFILKRYIFVTDILILKKHIFVRVFIEIWSEKVFVICTYVRMYVCM